ncbi:hypothetical protein SPURM210S_07334 [Streptomyces purpurascens]
MAVRQSREDGDPMAAGRLGGLGPWSAEGDADTLYAWALRLTASGACGG